MFLTAYLGNDSSDTSHDQAGLINSSKHRHSKPQQTYTHVTNSRITGNLINLKSKYD